MRTTLPSREVLDALYAYASRDGALDDVAAAARACLAYLDRANACDCAGSHRNAALVYRPVGAPGERYPAWVRDLRDRSGVYVIRDRATAEILYVGESHTRRLYPTLTRHFQEWRRYKGFWRGHYAEGHDPGLTYPRDAVEVAVRVTGDDAALDEEARLIHRLHPRDNLLGQPDEDVVPF